LHEIFLQDDNSPLPVSEPVVKIATSDTEAIYLRRLFELNILLALMSRTTNEPTLSRVKCH